MPHVFCVSKLYNTIGAQLPAHLSDTRADLQDARCLTRDSSVRCFARMNPLILLGLGFRVVTASQEHGRCRHEALVFRLQLAMACKKTVATDSFPTPRSWSVFFVGVGGLNRLEVPGRGDG